jgi:hypothetical protein
MEVGQVEAGFRGSVVGRGDDPDLDDIPCETAYIRLLPCVQTLDKRAIFRNRSGNCRAQTFLRGR